MTTTTTTTDQRIETLKNEIATINENIAAGTYDRSAAAMRKAKATRAALESDLWAIYDERAGR